MAYSYPWYDSDWLTEYVLTKNFIKQQYPHKYSEFVEAFEPLRTKLDFEVIKFDKIFDRQTLQECKNIIQNLELEQHERHELSSFGRLVVHNHTFFNDLQESLTDLVSKAVKEPVEPYYNFLSLYSAAGSCQVHMDAPEAKWTLDCCIEQSEPWAINFSQIQAWPETYAYDGEDWATQIKQDTNNTFSEYLLEEGEAVIFSGSSQWHYREPMPQTTKDFYCHLIFFHYLPVNMKEIIEPKNWSSLFKIPDSQTIKFFQTCI